MERRLRDLVKGAQRAALTTIQDEGGGLVVVLIGSTGCLLFLLLLQGIRLTLYPPNPCDFHCQSAPPGTASASFLNRDWGASDRIDAVYTWVNGSDENLISLMESYRGHTETTGRDDASSGNGVNRYRDNNELKYSLRSVERFAPWIRHVFIVTNGQVPSWLDQSYERVTVVPHSEIFSDPTHLPTFSSPSIESHLHEIDGVSRRFIYLNDDVMFGAPVFPDDFYTETRGQKVFMSWNVPDCANGCSDSWCGDGFCDTACNVTACDFDGGDCDGSSVADSTAQPEKYRSEEFRDYYAASWGDDHGSRAYYDNAQRNGVFSDGGDDSSSSWQSDELHAFKCAPGCREEWIGDHTCDYSCNLEECAYDAGDCASTQVKVSEIQSISLHPRAPKTAAPECESCDAVANITLEWPLKSAVFNVSGIFPFGDLGKITSSSHDSPSLIRVATLKKEFSSSLPYSTLIVLFENDEERLSAVFNRTKTNAAAISDFSDNVRMRFEFRGSGAGRGSAGYRPDLSFGTPVRSIDASSTSLRLVLYVTLLLPPPLPPLPATLEQENGAARLPAKDVLLTTHDSSSATGKDPTTDSSAVEEESGTYGVDDGTFSSYEAAPWDLDQSFPQDSTEPPPPPPLDTFGESLRHVSKLLNRAYGRTSSRKVPAHMPHMIDREVMARLRARWPEEWLVTSSNRFRSKNDMQFSFSYFHFLMNEPVPFDLARFWHNRLDVDGDGVLGVNELRTLAALVTNKLDYESLSQEDIDAVAQLVWDEALIAGVVGPLSALSSWATGAGITIDYATLAASITVVTRLEEREVETLLWGSDGSGDSWESGGWSSDSTTDGVLGGGSAKRMHMPYEIVPIYDLVTFMMITDNHTEMQPKLDGVRAKRTKFICLNDDMNNPEPATVNALRDLYKSMFPNPSLFERAGQRIQKQYDHASPNKMGRIRAPHKVETSVEARTNELSKAPFCGLFVCLLLGGVRFSKIYCSSSAEKSRL